MTQPRTKTLQRRSSPKQERSKRRAKQIMEATAQLLEQVGFDETTTILIAKELGISVGSLYHYFPNKQAILRAIAEGWLQEWDTTLDIISELPIETMDPMAICRQLTEILLVVYKQQKGILPLVEAMYAVPELRDLDSQHDKQVVRCMSEVFKRMGIIQSKNEMSRIAVIYLEISHNMLVQSLAQKGTRAARTLDDLNHIIYGLLMRYKS